jgi:hypothetical protein
MNRLPALLRLASPPRRPSQARPSQELRRRYSSAGAAPSKHASFYKTFGRPILKVALGAIFTYQLAYYGWVKMETIEVQTDIAGT